MGSKHIVSHHGSSVNGYKKRVKRKKKNNVSVHGISSPKIQSMLSPVLQRSCKSKERKKLKKKVVPDPIQFIQVIKPKLKTINTSLERSLEEAYEMVTCGSRGISPR